jgi:hypothetical protein
MAVAIRRITRAKTKLRGIKTDLYDILLKYQAGQLNQADALTMLGYLGDEIDEAINLLG